MILLVKAFFGAVADIFYAASYRGKPHRRNRGRKQLSVFFIAKILYLFFNDSPICAVPYKVYVLRESAHAGHFAYTSCAVTLRTKVTFAN